MYEYYFTFHSVTQAQRGLEELLRRGIYTELIRSPKKFSSAGCGYALKVLSSDGYTAAAALKIAGITPVRSLRVFDNGYSEVTGL